MKAELTWSARDLVVDQVMESHLLDRKDRCAIVDRFALELSCCTFASSRPVLVSLLVLVHRLKDSLVAQFVAMLA